MALTGNKDIDFKILLELNDTELGRVCQVNKYVNSLCNDDNFWRLKVYRFNSLITPDQYKYLNKGKTFYEFATWKDMYKNILERGGIYSFMVEDEDIEHINNELFIVENGIKDLIKALNSKSRKDIKRNLHNLSGHELLNKIIHDTIPELEELY